MMSGQKCRVCSCTQDDCSGCIERTGAPCYWIEDDLCSACVGEVKEVAVTCLFKDASGKGQKLTFEMDLIIGCDENAQLMLACVGALEDKSFKNSYCDDISYKILLDIN